MQLYWQAYNGDATQTIYQGDALEVLCSLPSESVHCCVTSPPYWGLRDYGVKGQIGLEPTLQEYIEVLVEVFREVRRVLRPDGTLWLNLGDSYWGSRGTNNNSGITGRRPPDGATKDECDSPVAYRAWWGQHPILKPKDLIGVPWRVAFALQADGWYLRSDIIWHKPNPMPESVTDRPTKAHEYIFLLSKSPRYYYDANAIREPAAYHVIAPGKLGAVGVSKRNDAPDVAVPHTVKDENATRNKRSVWTIATQPFPEAHFATFPEKLIEPMVLAGTSPKACPKCGAPWKRIVETPKFPKELRAKPGDPGVKVGYGNPMINTTDTGQKMQNWRNENPPQTVGWQPSCSCPDNDGSGRCVVLDLFVGSGTTLLVAQRFGRSGIGIELNPDYCAIASRRINREQCR